MKQLCVKVFVFLLVAFISISSYSAANQYFNEAYNSDGAFKNSFLSALKSAGISKPSWVPDGVSTPMEPVAVGGNNYLAAMICEPHNCSHKIVFLYLESQKRIVGTYFPENGAPISFGNPTELERKQLEQM